MRILISGVCGFVGSHLARYVIESCIGITIVGLDNLARPGSEVNRVSLKHLGVQLFHGDIRMASDLETLPHTDWVIDAAAQPSVLAGRDGKTSSRQLLVHNLLGTINILEYCRSSQAGLILLSTSRVYSIHTLAQLPLRVESSAFTLDERQHLPAGISLDGVGEGFSTEAPISLYGATKLASEHLAHEYASGFQMPLWINRCGVLEGAGQFGTAEQGIFSYWVRAWASGHRLTYLGFDGSGHQVRDALHAQDLADLVERQVRGGPDAAGVWNAGGGPANAMSLAQLSGWCAGRFGPRVVGVDREPRKWDVPWVVMDATRARDRFGWTPAVTLERILDEIADHHRRHPDWLALTEPL